MQIASKGRAAFMAGVGILITSALASAPAVAQTVPAPHHHYHHYHHHHHYRHHAFTPQLRQADFGPTSPGVSSALINVQTGEIIATNGADIPRYPASLTKLMTLDLAFQAIAAGRLSLDTQIPVSYAAASVEPVKLGLQPGDTISVRNAIMAMTTMSANDAATALGQYLGGGSLARCADMMTLRAHALGMAQTEFTNPSGLPNPYQVTTARDMAMLARDIVRGYPQFQHFFEIRSFDYNGRTIYSNNAMLKLYPGTTGMKTGYTDLARHNLVTSVERDGRGLIGVVLHEPSWGMAYTQMTAMLNTGFYSHVAANQPGSAAQNRLSQPATQIERVSSRTVESAKQLPDSIEGQQRISAPQWSVRLGLYHYKTNARLAALNAYHFQDHGIAQIQHLDQNGRVLWLAQLAGLTYNGALDTCRAVHAHNGLCAIHRQDDDHLAMLTTVSDDRT